MKPLRPLARFVRVMLLISGLSAAAAALLGWWLGPAANDDATYGLVGGVQGLALLIGGIAFLMWVYRSTANAHAFGAEGLSAGPGLAVGWYFIPIANLGMPLMTMRETWKASIEPRDWEIVPAPAITWIWWFFWLTSNIAGLVALRLAWEADFDMDATAHSLVVASDALSVPAALGLWSIVGVITGLQDERITSAAVIEESQSRPAVARVE